MNNIGIKECDNSATIRKRKLPSSFVSSGSRENSDENDSGEDDLGQCANTDHIIKKSCQQEHDRIESSVNSLQNLLGAQF